jgi:hypothetical protein
MLIGAFPVNRNALDEMAANFSHYYAQGGQERQTNLGNVQRIMDLIDTLTVGPADSEGLWEIISEEASSYLSGPKTAEEVAAIIQNRASIWLAER